MSILVDTLNSPKVSNQMSNTEVEIIEGLFNVQDYKSGTAIAQPEDRQLKEVSILAQGSIKVKVQSGVGESTIRILKPGDILEPGDLAGISTFGNEADSQTKTKLYAVGDTKILSLDRGTAESIFNFQPEMMSNVIRDI